MQKLQSQGGGLDDELLEKFAAIKKVPLEKFTFRK